MCLGSIEFFSGLSHAVIFRRSFAADNFDGIMNVNLLLVRQVFGTVIVVTVGVVYTAACKSQESRRFRDADDALAAGSI